MRFEEIEVPSDVEGYDVGASAQERADAAKRNSSWFGWGSPVKEGTDKPKSE
jgi:receptor expression-enhancing protein 1/2/3/4